MSVAIILVGFADGRRSTFDGQYLTFYDPDFRDGLGRVDSSDDITKAMKFDDATAAFTLWKSVSKVKSTRDDGLPNRPMTAFTITTEDIP